MSRYSNKIESVGLRKCPYYRYIIKKVSSTDVRITNISQSLSHKMAENSRYEEITSLSPYVCASRSPFAIAESLVSLDSRAVIWRQYNLILTVEFASLDFWKMEVEAERGMCRDAALTAGVAVSVNSNTVSALSCLLIAGSITGLLIVTALRSTCDALRIIPATTLMTTTMPLMTCNYNVEDSASLHLQPSVRFLSVTMNYINLYVLFMVALWNRADHYIFILWFLVAALRSRCGHYILPCGFFLSIFFLA